MLEKITLKLCPEEFKGTKTYRLTEAHFRGNRMYKAGDLITVTDEKPGQTWEPVDAEAAKSAAKKPEAKSEAKTPTRASDRSI